MISDKPDLLQPGENFRGYVIERLLGKGGLGAVYLVRHEMLDTLYALKVLYPDVAKENPSYIKREYDHKQQVVVGSVIMFCVALAMILMNNYNPKR